MRRFSILVIALTLLGTVPFASAEEIDMSLHSVGSALLNYVPNRVNDLFDIVHASIGFGPGYGLGVRATSEIGMEISDYNSLRFGWDEGGVLPQVWDSQHSSNGASLGPLQCGEIDQDAGELGVGLHVGIIGADAAVDLYEAVDCVLGLLMIDTSEDDNGPVIASLEEADRWK